MTLEAKSRVMRPQAGGGEGGFSPGALGVRSLDFGLPAWAASREALRCC